MKKAPPPTESLPDDDDVSLGTQPLVELPAERVAWLMAVVVMLLLGALVLP
jgi:hypothetical protein